MNMFAANRLGLGTAQFGMDYGISNRRGRLPTEIIGKILAIANKAGVSTLDTAPSYGDSELLLGDMLPQPNGFKIVTKTLPIVGAVVTENDAYAVLTAACESCRRLRVASLHGLLVHSVRDVLLPGGKMIVSALQELKQKGIIKKAGISVYDAEEIDAVLKIFVPDLVQLPVNVLDQRLIRSGHLAHLKDLGVEIHARSIFLQGLLLMTPTETPSYFRPIRPTLELLHTFWKSVGISPVAGCLAFGFGRPEIDTLLVGVNSPFELEEIVESASQNFSTVCPPHVSCDSPHFLNPFRWPEFSCS